MVATLANVGGCAGVRWGVLWRTVMGGGRPLAWILPTLRFPAIASRHADRIVAWAAGNVPGLI